MTDLIVYSALARQPGTGRCGRLRPLVPAPAGNETMVAIAGAIRLGANTFLRREYTWMAAFVALLAVLIVVLTPGAPWGSVAYVFGARPALRGRRSGWDAGSPPPPTRGQPKRRGAVAPGRRYRSFRGER